MDILFSQQTDSYGYKTFRNDYGWDNEKMLELLSKNNLVYGVPKMGWIRAFGKERQVIVYNLAHETNYVYVDAQKRKIVISMAPKPGQTFMRRHRTRSARLSEPCRWSIRSRRSSSL